MREEGREGSGSSDNEEGRKREGDMKIPDERERGLVLVH